LKKIDHATPAAGLVCPVRARCTNGYRKAARLTEIAQRENISLEQVVAVGDEVVVVVSSRSAKVTLLDRRSLRPLRILGGFRGDVAPQRPSPRYRAALVAVAITFIWGMFGTNLIIFLAGMCWFAFLVIIGTVVALKTYDSYRRRGATAAEVQGLGMQATVPVPTQAAVSSANLYRRPPGPLLAISPFGARCPYWPTPLTAAPRRGAFPVERVP